MELTRLRGHSSAWSARVGREGCVHARTRPVRAGVSPAGGRVGALQRPVEFEDVAEKWALLREVIGDAVRVRLAGLDQPACARFLRTIFASGITDEVVADWRVATCGNPYLLGLRPRDLGERSGELVARLAQAGPQVVALARSFTC